MTDQLHRPAPTQHLAAWTELTEQRASRARQLAELATAELEASTSADEARRELTKALSAGARQALVEVEAALQRFAAGTFGACEQCGAAIPDERLEILPMTRYCTPCQRSAQALARR